MVNESPGRCAPARGAGRMRIEASLRLARVGIIHSTRLARRAAPRPANAATIHIRLICCSHHTVIALDGR